MIIPNRFDWYAADRRAFRLGTLAMVCAALASAVLLYGVVVIHQVCRVLP